MGDTELVGRRTIRFEAAGPDVATVVGSVRSSGLTSLAGRPVSAMWNRPEGLQIDIAGATVTLAANAAARSITVIATAPAAADVLDLVRAGVSIVADPERRRVTRSFAVPSEAITARAAEIFAAVPGGQARLDDLRLAIRCVDLTTLAGDDTPGRVRALCAEALRPHPLDATVGPTAAVCVYPSLVAVAAELLGDTPVEVASVAGAFPSGLSSLRVRLADIADAIHAGASEIDVVLNRSAFVSGDTGLVTSDLRAMRDAIGTLSMKTIIEIDELAAPEAIRAASRLAMEAGTDWVKTSTGKTGNGATPVGVLAIAQSISEHHGDGGHEVGLKISGGVRTSEDALGYLAIVREVLGARWMNPDRLRFGASGLVGAIVADLPAPADS